MTTIRGELKIIGDPIDKLTGYIVIYSIVNIMYEVELESDDIIEIIKELQQLIREKQNELMNVNI